MREPSLDQRAFADLHIVIMAIATLVLLAQTVSTHLNYPYDLEWMEGGMLVHAQRVLDGQSLYVLPQADFIPFIYPPLYPWVLGLLGHVVDLDYALGRAVSIAGVMAAAAAIIVAVREERGGWGPAIGGAALFLACYPDSGGFFDLVRVDGLMMGLLAWALVLTRRENVRWAGLLLFLAFATKHGTALYGLPALIWLWRRAGKPRAMGFLIWSAGPALVFTVGMTVLSGGLFLTYILEVPAAHPFVFKRFLQTAPLELGNALPWTSGLAVLALLIYRRVGRGGAFWLAQGLLGILLCMVMRGHQGGFLNVLMPGTWFLALWGALAVSAVRRRWPTFPVYLGTALLVAWQLWDTRWPVDRYAPTPADKLAGDAIVEQLRQIEGPVLAPYSPYLPHQAGKEGSVSLIALWDIRKKHGPLFEESRVIRKHLAQQHWGAVRFSWDKSIRGLEGLYKHYKRATFQPSPAGKCGVPRRPKRNYNWKAHWEQRVFCPRTGHPRKPKQLWVPDEG